MRVTNAFDYKKNIFLTTGDNLYCDNHKFKNEDILREEAIIVEYDSIDDAMRVIDNAKNVKEVKKEYFQND
jgi:hypothetical protein